jgi:Na+/H+ antiporter NhaC
MKKILLITGFILASAVPLFSNEMSVEVTFPKVIMADIPAEIKFTLIDDANFKLTTIDTIVQVQGLTTLKDEQLTDISEIAFKGGEAVLSSVVFVTSGQADIEIESLNWSTTIRIIPGWMSIIPPLFAILLALLVRQVLIALFVGIWIGTILIYDYNPFAGFLYTVTDYIAIAAVDPNKMAIIVFTLTLGGMVGVISKMGGMQGIVDRVTQQASSSRRGQIFTWLMGVFIFFDDYTNTLIVGNTMRPLTDKLRISREKLAYLVDSTAAPVANIAIISTWIGFEIGLIGNSFESLGITDNPYLVFLQTIPYNFYPIFALIIGLTIAVTGRDFGPMFQAERRSYQTGQVLAPNATPVSSLDSNEIIADKETVKRWYNGFIPIFVVILTTLLGLWLTGYSSLKNSNIDLSSLGFFQYASLVIGESDSYAVLMWSSLLGSITAIILARGQKLLSLDKTMLAWIGGAKAMLLAALILTMAWSIGNICQDLNTAAFIIQVTEGFLSPYFIPLLSFLIAALISFATGTSWGVMAILMPIVIPIAHLVPQTDPAITQFQQQGILLSTIASVLAGATFGDHCSPISDTTIMSSMASGADHIDHVKTQIPYALLGGTLSMVIGYLPVGYGISPWIVLPLGLCICIAVIRFFGKKAVAVN